ncbi:hypothetical protein ACMFMG_001938 [Clarireedia jacksonii]
MREAHAVERVVEDGAGRGQDGCAVDEFPGGAGADVDVGVGGGVGVRIGTCINICIIIIIICSSSVRDAAARRAKGLRGPTCDAQPVVGKDEGECGNADVAGGERDGVSVFGGEVGGVDEVVVDCSG